MGRDYAHQGRTFVMKLLDNMTYSERGGCVFNVWFALTTLGGGHNLLPLKYLGVRGAPNS